MRRRSSSLIFILPTADLVLEHEPSELLLEKIDVPLRRLADYIIEQWVLLESEPWRHFDAVQRQTTFSRLMTYVTMDFLSEDDVVARYMTREDRRDAEFLIEQFCQDFYTKIIPILQEMNLTDYQLSTLNVNRWVGRSMVIDIVPN